MHGFAENRSLYFLFSRLHLFHLDVRPSSDLRLGLSLPGLPPLASYSNEDWVVCGLGGLSGAATVLGCRRCGRH